MYTGREQKGATTKTNRKQTQKPYLLPNYVRKSRTKCVLATLYRLAQVHKLETKLALILWAEETSFSNTNLFLARQRFQNRHKGDANQIFLRFLPTTAPCQAKRVRRTDCKKTPLIPTIDQKRSHNILTLFQ